MHKIMQPLGRAVAPGERVAMLDILRGVSVFLMVIHHFLYDLVAFCSAPVWLFKNPVFQELHYFFAGLFVLLSGIACRFSHSNLLRGAKLLGIALALSAVTILIDMPILFGVLHLLSVCMLLYGFFGKRLEALPRFVEPILYALLFGGSLLLCRAANPVPFPFLFPLGFVPSGFYSADYFPLFPWMFVFFLGAWLGGFIRAGAFPALFYRAKPHFFAFLGRHALIVYLVHQPVLFCLAKALASFVSF